MNSVDDSEQQRNISEWHKNDPPQDPPGPQALIAPQRFPGVRTTPRSFIAIGQVVYDRIRIMKHGRQHRLIFLKIEMFQIMFEI